MRLHLTQMFLIRPAVRLRDATTTSSPFAAWSGSTGNRSRRTSVRDPARRLSTGAGDQRAPAADRSHPRHAGRPASGARTCSWRDFVTAAAGVTAARRQCAIRASPPTRAAVPVESIEENPNEPNPATRDGPLHCPAVHAERHALTRLNLGADGRLPERDGQRALPGQYPARRRRRRKLRIGAAHSLRTWLAGVQ